jgi:hypothetical protein
MGLPLHLTQGQCANLLWSDLANSFLLTAQPQECQIMIVLKEGRHG